MAADFITITRTNRPQKGAEIVRAANDLIDLCDRIKALSAGAGHMVDAADYSLFEAQFGLTAGAGANAATLLGYMDEIFNTGTDVTGANRLARLNEFKARLAGQ